MMKTCSKCNVAKPANEHNFVRNRPSFSRGFELPRTYHNTCKVCESEAKKKAWAIRLEATAKYAAHNKAEQTEEARIKARVLADEEILRARAKAEGSQ